MRGLAPCLICRFSLPVGPASRLGGSAGPAPLGDCACLRPAGRRPGCGHPDLSQEPGAVAGCEAPGPGDLDPQPIMLPGRRCAACHDKGPSGRQPRGPPPAPSMTAPTRPAIAASWPAPRSRSPTRPARSSSPSPPTAAATSTPRSRCATPGIIVRVSKDGKMREMQARWQHRLRKLPPARRSRRRSRLPELISAASRGPPPHPPPGASLFVSHRISVDI